MTDTVWIHYSRPRPHWYTLPQDQKQALQDGWDAARRQAEAGGAVFNGHFHIRGQHDFETVEIWRFPDSQAIFAHWSALCDSRYNQFFAFTNNIGLEDVS